jgi:hypothetical protein
MVSQFSRSRKKTVIVCVLIQEKVNEAQSEYHLFSAGFLPTKMMKLKTGRTSFGINQLLYAGGLLSYLEQSQTTPNNAHQLVESSLDNSNKTNITPESEQNQRPNITLVYDKFSDKFSQKGEYAPAINNYNQALQHKPCADIYYKLELSYY